MLLEEIEVVANIFRTGADLGVDRVLHSLYEKETVKFNGVKL